MGTHLRVLSKSYLIEYQHDRVSMVFRNICILVLYTKVTLALEGLNKGYIARTLPKTLLAEQDKLSLKKVFFAPPALPLAPPLC